MTSTIRVLGVTTAIIFSGCAKLDFGDNGMTYYDPKPYLFVSTTKECVTTATVVTIPETKRALHFRTGYGAAELSATVASGMLTSVGQKTDTKIPETIAAIAGLKTALVPQVATTGKEIICKPSAALYPITSGMPETAKPVQFPVSTEVIDLTRPTQ